MSDNAGKECEALTIEERIKRKYLREAEVAEQNRCAAASASILADSSNTEAQTGCAIEEPPVRARILNAALQATTGDRNRSYGSSGPNLTAAAELADVYRRYAHGKYCKAHDQAVYLLLHKLARIACGATGHADNYIDGAAYFAIAAECQQEAEPKVPRCDVKELQTITRPTVPVGWKYSHEPISYKIKDFVLLDNGGVFQIIMLGGDGSVPSMYKVCEVFYPGCIDRNRTIIVNPKTIVCAVVQA